MNKTRRKELERAADLLTEAQEIIEAMRGEEQEAYDNLPESLQEAERGEQMIEYIDAMDEAMSSIDDLRDSIRGIVEG